MAGRKIKKLGFDYVHDKKNDYYGYWQLGELVWARLTWPESLPWWPAIVVDRPKKRYFNTGIVGIIIHERSFINSILFYKILLDYYVFVFVCI